MSIPQIVVRNLSQTYRVPEREVDLIASIQSLWARKYRNVEAVQDLSFSIARGQMAIELFTGLIYQVVWLLVSLVLFTIVWRGGQQHYTTIGG